MICCKITSNFRSGAGRFGSLYKELGKIGNLLYINGSLFFGSTLQKVDAKKVSSVMKKAGYPQHFIEEYGKDNEPREENCVNGWLYDQLVAINARGYEMESQKEFHRIAAALDEIDKKTGEIISSSKCKTEVPNCKGGPEDAGKQEEKAG